MIERQSLILFIKEYISNAEKKTSIVVLFFPILFTKFYMSEGMAYLIQYGLSPGRSSQKIEGDPF